MPITEIDVNQLRSLLDSDALYACFDVRERGEFGLEQIEGVTPLARGTLEYRLPVMVPSRNVPIAVLCDDGRRSRLAAQTIEAMGYRDVRVVSGGLEAWKARGLPTIAGWGVRGKEYAERIAVDEQVPQTTAEELAEMRRRGQTVTVVDVRTSEEFLRGHVPDAYHVPGGELLRNSPLLPREADHTLVISCAGRTRGILGAYVLRRAGFTNVSALLNGAMGWRLAGLELETGSAKHDFGKTSTLGEETAAASQSTADAGEIPIISAADFEALRRSEGPFYAVDVRLPDEYRGGHLPGSISIPAGQFALQHENFLAVRRAPVVILSDDAVRPGWAARQCRDLGFVHTYVLDRGIGGWAALPGHGLESGDLPLETFGLEAAQSALPTASVDEVRDLQTNQAATLLLDVRSSGEFGLGHIPGARWLARGKLELDIDRLASDQATPIITVCDSTVRSTLAAATLRSLGYRDVRVMDGGLPTWKAAGLALVDTLEGADVSTIEAQNDAGSTQWTGALARSRADMENYLAAEEALARR